MSESVKAASDAPQRRDLEDARALNAGSGRRWWLGLLLSWAAARVILFVHAVPWMLPDSVKYLEGTAIRLDGRSSSPGWVLPTLYRFLPDDEWRTWLQFAIASACWATAAWLLGNAGSRPWQRNALFGFVLTFSLAVPVVSLDRILQTESVAVSLTVLWLALAVHAVVANCASTGLWWPVLVGSLAVFTRPQLGPIIGVVTVAVLVLQLSRNRRFTVALALSLAAMIGVTGWSAVALRNFDQYNDHAAARAYFMSWYRSTDAGYLAMEKGMGRPPCPSLERLTRDVPTASENFAWNYYFNSYKRECPELVAWHREEAPNYFERVLKGPLPTLRLMTRDLPVLLQPWVRGDNAIPFGSLQATVFGITDQSGLVNTEPQPGVQSLLDQPRATSPYNFNGVSIAPIWALGLWIVAALVIAVFSHARGLRISKPVLLGCLFLLGATGLGVALSWAADAWEMDRHSLPWSLLIPLVLFVTVLVSWREPGATRAEGEHSQARIWLSLAAVTVGLSWVQAHQQLLADPQSPLPRSAAQADELRDLVQSIVWDNSETADANRVMWLREAPLPAPAEGLKASTSSTSTFAVSLREGLWVSGVLMEPVGPARCAVIFNGGHGPWWVESLDFLRTALAQDCVVAAISMPLMESTSQVARAGTQVSVTTRFNNHYGLELVATPDDNVLDLFVTGPVAVTDWFARTRPGLPILMTGFSGGGFVTTLATAVDPRALRSVAIAGSTDQSGSVNCKDDYEQCLPELLDVITMPDLYLLSAYSRDPVERKAGQVLNAGDPCCHQGVPTPEWEQQVNEALMSFTDDRFSYRLGREMPPAHRIPGDANRLLAEYVNEVSEQP